MPLRAMIVVAVSMGLLVTACAAGRASTRPAGEPASSERKVVLQGTAGSLRVSDGGAGEPALVLLHGLGSDLETWRPLLARLRASRRVVAYDQRGHGDSARTPGGYTIAALAGDLEAVRRGLGIERMVLVGHSMSGTVLTAYAGAHPERVAGLVYLDAIGGFDGVPREALQPLVERETAPGFGASEVRATFEEMIGPKARPATREAVLAQVARLDPPAFGALRQEMFEFRGARRRLGAYEGPMLAIEAADNPYPTVLASHVLGARRVEVAGVSHWVQLDDPDAVARALEGFLAGLPR